MRTCYWGQRVELDFLFIDSGDENRYKYFKIDFIIFSKVELYEFNNFIFRCIFQLIYSIGYEVIFVKDVLCRIFV